MNQLEKILIVDDEPDTVTILRDRLEMDHYEVIAAASGTPPWSRLIVTFQI